jgi:hypothetical protein
VETGQRARRDRLLSVLVPLVLVAVAATQVVVASTTDLTAWRGGGFGMFSTIDAHSTRFLRVTVDTHDGRSVAVHVPSLLAEDAEVHEELVDHRAWPRQRTVDALATGLDAVPVAIEDGVAQADPVGVPLSIRSVEVEVWTLEFGLDTATVTPRLLDRRTGTP